MQKSLTRAFLATATFLVAASFTGAAQATIINFDDQGLTGPSTPSGVAPVSVTAGGDTVNFSNGQILTNETFLPADETSVYYNSYFTPGSTGAAMTVTFSAPVVNFFLNLYNGEVYTDSFTVSDNAGHSTTVSIPSNGNGGLSLISFPATGNIITITTTDANYDYSIDDIGFNQPTPGVPEPATWAMFLVGFGGIGLMMRNARRKGAVATA
jgi:PEP-CTERM motif